MDTLTNLKAFLSVARTGSFTAAARELHVSPSVITKRIGQMEWRLKGTLFERTTRHVSLTALGQRYLPHARRLASDFDNLFGDANDSANSLQGSVRVKIPSAVAAVMIAPLLHSFAQSHPLIQLEVIALDRAVNPLDEGFDIALTLMPHSYSSVIDIPLYEMPRYLCASPEYLARKGHPTHPIDLVQHDTLNFLPSGNTWKFTSKVGPIEIAIEPRLSTNEAQLLLSAALANNGIAILGNYLAAPALQTGNLVKVLEDYLIDHLWLKALVPENRIEIPRVHALIEWLKHKLTSDACKRPESRASLPPTDLTLAPL
jgi:DNA-binding transcriptional LysR family regulator